MVFLAVLNILACRDGAYGRVLVSVDETYNASADAEVIAEVCGAIRQTVYLSQIVATHPKNG